MSALTAGIRLGDRWPFKNDAIDSQRAYEFIAAGDRFEQLAEMFSEELAVFLIGQVWMDAKKLDVANQMRDAKLKFDVLIELHELAIHREVVAANHSIKLCPDRFDQYLAAAAGRDFKDS